MSSTFGTLFQGDHLRRVPLPRRRGGGGRLPAALALTRGRHPAPARPSPAGPEPPDHRRGRGRRGHGAVRHRERDDPRHPDRPARAQPRPAARRLRRHAARSRGPPTRTTPTSVKYGMRAASGGGRSSARETIGRVAAGADRREVAAGAVRRARSWPGSARGRDGRPGAVDVGIARPSGGRRRIGALSGRGRGRPHVRRPSRGAKEAKDPLGGVVTCVCRNVPAGVGRARVRQAGGHAGAGHAVASGDQGLRDRLGLRRHAPARQPPQRPLRAEGRPPRDAHQPQRRGPGRHHQRRADRLPRGVQAAGHDRRSRSRRPDFDGEPATLEAKGRHDPCVVPRAVPIVESMAALVLADLALIQAMRQPVA